MPTVYIHAKNYENWLAVDKVIAKIIRLTFWPTLYIRDGIRNKPFLTFVSQQWVLFSAACYLLYMGPTIIFDVHASNGE